MRQQIAAHADSQADRSRRRRRVRRRRRGRAWASGSRRAHADRRYRRRTRGVMVTAATHDRERAHPAPTVPTSRGRLVVHARPRRAGGRDVVAEAEDVVRVVGALELAQPLPVRRRIGGVGAPRVAEEVQERVAGGVWRQPVGGLGRAVDGDREGQVAVAGRSGARSGLGNRAAPVADLDGVRRARRRRRRSRRRTVARTGRTAAARCRRSTPVSAKPITRKSSASGVPGRLEQGLQRAPGVLGLARVQAADRERVLRHHDRGALSSSGCVLAQSR